MVFWRQTKLIIFLLVAKQQQNNHIIILSQNEQNRGWFSADTTVLHIDDKVYIWKTGALPTAPFSLKPYREDANGHTVLCNVSQNLISMALLITTSSSAFCQPPTDCTYRFPVVSHFRFLHNFPKPLLSVVASKYGIYFRDLPHLF